MGIVVLNMLLAATFIGTGSVKLIGIRQSLDIRDRLRIPARLWRPIGVLELAGAAGLLLGLAVRPLGVAAAAGLTLLMAGAVTSRVRVRDRAVFVAMDVLVAALVLTAGILQVT